MINKKITKNIIQYLQVDVASIPDDKKVGVLTETLAFIKDNARINVMFHAQTEALIYTYNHPEILLTDLNDEVPPPAEEIQAIISVVLIEELSRYKKFLEARQHYPLPKIQNSYVTFKIDKLENEALSSLNFYFRTGYEFYKARQAIACYIEQQGFEEYSISGQDYAKVEAMASHRYKNTNVIVLYLTPFFTVAHQIKVVQLLVGCTQKQKQEIISELENNNKTHNFILPEQDLGIADKIRHIFQEVDKIQKGKLSDILYLYDFAINELQRIFQKNDGWTLEEVALAKELATKTQDLSINSAYLYNVIGVYHERRQEFELAVSTFTQSNDVSLINFEQAKYRSAPVVFNVGDTSDQRILKLNINNYKNMIACAKRVNQVMIELENYKTGLQTCIKKLNSIVKRPVYETGKDKPQFHDSAVFDQAGSLYTECLHEAGIYAAEREDWETVIWLIKNKIVDVNWPNNQGRALLHLAASSADQEICEQLIVEGAKLDLLTAHCCTPLQLSIFNPNEEVTRFLLEKGADVNNRDRDGDTPLHELFIGEKVGVNIAARAKLLCQYESSLSLENNKQKTPVALMLDKKQYALVLFFGQSGKKIAGLWPYLVEIVKSYSSTIEQKKMLEWVIKNEVEIHRQDEKGNGLLHYLCNVTCNEERLEWIAQLIAKGLQLEQRNFDHETPIMLAITKRIDPKIITTLFTLANIAPENNNIKFQQYFYEVLKNADVSVIQFFLDWSKNLTVGNVDVVQALKMFMCNSCWRFSQAQQLITIAKILLALCDAKAIPILVDHAITNKTPIAFIELLLETGKPTLIELNSYLHQAAKSQASREVIAVFIKQGADITSKNLQGEMAYQLVGNNKSLQTLLMPPKPWKEKLIMTFGFKQQQIITVKKGLVKSLEITTPNPEEAKEVCNAIQQKIDPKQSMGGLIAIDFVNKNAVKVSFGAKKKLKACLFSVSAPLSDEKKKTEKQEKPTFRV